MRRLLLFSLLLCAAGFTPLLAQKKNEQYQLHISRATSPIVVDGTVDEPAWQAAEVASDFWMVLPMDTSRAKVRTDVRMAYDDHHIYLSAVCYHGNVEGPYIVESLRRDWSFTKNDNFIFFMDTFDDQTNGFTFGTNAAGAQWDGLLYEGGKANLSWDNKWTSSVKNYADRYVLELAIPFKTIRYKRGISRWGINFSRQDLKTTEKSSWTPIQRQFPTASLALTGVLVWDQPPPQPGPNISLIPYALSGMTRDYQNGVPTQNRFDAGLDAKVAITSSLNLDLTVNPDFSQVDVDQQVTNLDRYELFFPEKRQFFLENGDQFTNFGYATIRPFFSRRIGLGGVPIRFGARLSGKLNKDWRIGIMDMQTGGVDYSGSGVESLPAQNFAVVALQRRIFARSNIGLMFVNKESLGYTPTTDKPAYTRYNRNFGLEYNLASANNVWSGKALYVKSFSPDVSGTDQSGSDAVYAANLQYNTRQWLIGGQVESVGKNYTAEAGYVPRRAYERVMGTLGYTFLPTASGVLSHGPTVVSTYFFDPAGRQSDNETMLSYIVTFRSKSVFTGWVATDYVRLLQPFDPTNTGRQTLATGTQHNWTAWGTDFDSKPQSVFTYGFSTRYGGYYDNGTRLNLTADLGYRFQPYVSLAASASYNDIRLPQPWGQTTFWLVGPRFDVTLTNTLYLTTFVQYNEQQKNMNVNARIQWRYKPASDFFLVYTDNYLPNSAQIGQDVPGFFSVKNRALVLKWTYWWNL
ncbi:carbohydrate binding family 9 domain-containing protein [Spirosoma radiotolerans]|uniref:carbohydrate binding family 9 domain-containing protein n=1 Tax=Spirosoma radiotolerans TaxID=1379870 RepID=UPI0006271AB6|nr:carbohydrate binding family 9 domain-containing protein [Spirosoma radiotolerans]